MNSIERPEGKPLVPTFVLVLIALLAILALPGILFAWISNSRARQSEALVVPIRQGGNNEQEIIVSTERVNLYVPEDATELSGNFVISPRQPNLYAFASEPDWTRPVVVDIEYRNEDGLSHPAVAFTKPVSVCFVMTRGEWNDFTGREADFLVQFFDSEQSPSQWVSLPLSMDPDRRELCGEIDHLSTFALAVKPVEVIPVTGPTLTSTPTPTPTTTVFNTEESTRNRNNETATPVPPATNTNPPPQPTNTTVIRPSSTPLPTNTPRPTNTQPLPTATNVPPTATNPPPTATKPPPTVPPTATNPPPTDPPTDPPPTDPPATDPPATEPPAALESLIGGVLSGLGVE